MHVLDAGFQIFLVSHINNALIGDELLALLFHMREFYSGEKVYDT